MRNKKFKKRLEELEENFYDFLSKHLAEQKKYWKESISEEIFTGTFVGADQDIKTTRSFKTQANTDKVSNDVTEIRHNISLLIKEDEVGSEYIEALKEVLAIRVERRRKYGDEYLNDTLPFLADQIANKFKRFAQNRLSGNDFYETERDSLIDIINYSLFYIYNSKK